MSSTTDPLLTQINLFYKKDFYKKASNYLDAIQSYSSELDISINYLKSLVANDPITAGCDVFVKLDQQMKSMTPQFMSFWIQKYNQAHEKIKNEVMVIGLEEQANLIITVGQEEAIVTGKQIGRASCRERV